MEQKNDKNRTVEIDFKQFKVVMSISLTFFNILLLAAVITLICSWNRWFIWLICLAVECYCLASSFYTFFKSKNRLSYTLTDKAFVILSTTLDVEIPYEEITKIIVKTALWDKLLKRKEQTMIIHTTHKKQSKYAVCFIKEDANKLAEELLELSQKSNQNI